MKKYIYISITILNTLFFNVLNAQILGKNNQLYFSGSLAIHQFEFSPNAEDGVFVSEIEAANRFTFARSSKNLSIGMVQKLNRNFSLTYSIGYTIRNEKFYYQLEELNATIGNLSSANSQLTFNVLKNKSEKVEDVSLRLLDFSVGGRYYINKVKSDWSPYIYSALKPSLRLSDNKLELGAETGFGVSLAFLGQQLNLEPFVNYLFLSKHENTTSLIEIRPTSAVGLRILLSTENKKYKRPHK